MRLALSSGVGCEVRVRSFAQLLVLLSLLWLGGGVCSSAHGAEQIDQITLVRAESDDAVDALRESDPNTLRARSGDTLVLKLAVGGPYEITIDKARLSSLGNTIIRGTTPSGGTSLMVIGTDGSVRGHFERPDEVVQVSSDEDGVVTAWVEGVDAQVVPLDDGVFIPPDNKREDIAEPLTDELRDAAAAEAGATSHSDVSYAKFKTGQSTIRILIYYEDTMAEVGTVADYLVEITNTAFNESGLSVLLEIAAFQSVTLGPTPIVSDVWNLMRGGDAPFSSIEADLSAANADLAATLIGSYNEEDTFWGYAGIGGKFSTERFSVTRYRGYQEGNPVYPTDLFAHEIGHNLGANHNREQYENDGQDRTYTFSYAFGYLIEGVQRTIMSYRSETYGNERPVYLFSNSGLTYEGYPVGISTNNVNSAFVARAFENNRHVAAGSQTFSFEQIRHESRLSDGGECGLFRGMRIINDSQSTISLESRNYVQPDGYVATFNWSPPRQVAPKTSLSWGFCRPEGQLNPLGTTYTSSFFRYYHPVTGDLIEGPHFQWSENYLPQSELRIAYSDGGAPAGNTVRMIPVGYEEGVVFEPDYGFGISEIKSTCEGVATGIGYIVIATDDGCRIEASFAGNATPPTMPIITDIQAGDGVASISVNVPDDGGADITAISASCTYGSNTYSGESGEFTSLSGRDDKWAYL